MLAPTSLVVGPGVTAQSTIAVTSASDAATSTYGVTMSATDIVHSAYPSSAAATYTVQSPPDMVAPSAPSGLTASANQKLKQIQLSWIGSTDNVGVAGYRVWRNGVIVGTSTTTSWIDSVYTAGATYTYSVTGYDAAGNVSLPSTTTITLGTAGKKR